MTNPYDIVAILGYDPKPEHFFGYIRQQTFNQCIAALCNDGHFGGSFIFTAEDNRRPEWLNQAFPSGLPPGDSILIADVDLETRAVEVGTANPSPLMKLGRRSAI